MNTKIMSGKSVGISSENKGRKLINQEGRIPRRFLGKKYPSKGEYYDYDTDDSTYYIEHCNPEGYCKQVVCDMNEVTCKKQLCDTNGICYDFPLESCNYERDCSYKNIVWYDNEYEKGEDDIYTMHECDSQNKKCHIAECLGSNPSGGDINCGAVRIEELKECDYKDKCTPKFTSVKGLCTYEGCKVYQSDGERCWYYLCNTKFQSCNTSNPIQCTSEERENIFSNRRNVDISVTSKCHALNCKLTECDNTNKKCYEAICRTNGEGCTEWVPCIEGYEKNCENKKEKKIENKKEKSNTWFIILLILGIIIMIGIGLSFYFYSK